MTILELAYRVGQRARNDGLLLAGLELGTVVTASALYATCMYGGLIAQVAGDGLIAAGGWIAEMAEYKE